MSIQSDLNELDKLEIEIQNLQKRLYEFRKQKKIVEQRVIDFLKHQETQGIRYNNRAILLETKNFRNKKNKTEKLNDISSVLRKHGIKNSEDLISEILDAQRGNPSANEVLKRISR